MQRRRLIAIAGGLLAAPAIVRAQGQTNGVALVIGNSKYQWEATLQNVRRDAPDVAKTFQSFGLKTELVQDATRDAMNRALDNFKAAAKGASFAAFYFAGHGASWERDTYLVPVDADLSNPNTVTTLVKSEATGEAMKGVANRLVVYDNCRNNPADGWRQLEAERSAGFSPEAQRAGVAGAPNTLVLFSTAPGRIARDGPPGANSPFAAAFMRRFQAASIDLQSTPSKLRRDLLIATEGKQVLWDRNNYQQPFVLTAPANHKSVAISSGSGWGGDPSRIIELTKAYGYAHENGLPLPSGLIAHRPPTNSRDTQKVGSFQYIGQSPMGKAPALLVVISVEEQKTAELIMSQKVRFNPETKKLDSGTAWRFITANVSGDKLEYVPRDEGPRIIFDWRDANSGSVTNLFDSQHGVGKNTPYSTRFTRLDG